ncbi:MAG: four helix bundle protein [Prevotella sp.]|nr:four helix bundle protein [Prevotella sp.]
MEPFQYDFSYRKLNVYNYSKDLVRLVYLFTSGFPDTEKYGLSNQLRRAVVSVPSNIAEGSGRSTYSDQHHFYSISLGSLMEVMCQLEIAFDLKLIDSQQLSIAEEKVAIIDKLLKSLIWRTKEMGK